MVIAMVFSAMLFGSLTRRTAYLDRRMTLGVVLLPLAVGVSWWIGIAATHWGPDTGYQVRALSGVTFAVSQRAHAA